MEKTTMDFAKLAEERYSVRKFDQRLVEKEKVETILKAGRIAPTACNNQPQRILVIDDADGMAKLKKCTSYTFGAPIAFIICFDKTESWIRSFDNDNSGVVDASIVTTHMMLQAADLGLGTTWVGYFDPAMRQVYITRHGFNPLVLLVNMKTFNSLSSNHQDIIISGAKKAAKTHNDSIMRKEDEYIGVLRDHSCDIVNESEVDLEPYRRIVFPTILNILKNRSPEAADWFLTIQNYAE